MKLSKNKIKQLLKVKNQSQKRININKKKNLHVRNKSSNKLLTGIKMEMVSLLRILMNCLNKSYQNILNIQICIHSLDN